MDEKDKLIDQLRIQLKAQKQMNNAMVAEIGLFQDEVEKLLADSNALLKSTISRFSRFKEQETNEKYPE